MRTMLRLLVGGSIEALDALRQLLAEAAASQVEPSTDDRSLEGTRHGLSPAVGVSKRWIQAGQAEVRSSRGLARSFARLAADRAAGSLADSRLVDGLVRAIAGNYLRYLETHPEALERLVRSQGDMFIAYLNQNPDMVKELVAGQSSGLATELVEGVRARAVSADNVFEMVARSILRRTPRAQLPEPPPDVQRRAERGTLPADLKPPKVDDDPGR